MILCDASALVAIFGDEPGRGEVETLLRSGAGAVTSVDAAEAIQRLLRWGADEGLLEDRWNGLVRAGLSVLPIDGGHAWRAGRLRARHYNRSNRALSLADCILLAAAGPDDAIATSDRAVVATARDEGIAVRPLLDSSGVRPE